MMNFGLYFTFQGGEQDRKKQPYEDARIVRRSWFTHEPDLKKPIYTEPFRTGRKITETQSDIGHFSTLVNTGDIRCLYGKTKNNS